MGRPIEKAQNLFVEATTVDIRVGEDCVRNAEDIACSLHVKEHRVPSLGATVADGEYSGLR
jgi:hypothetical protein